MASFVSFILYAAVSTAAVLILTYFAGTTTTSTKQTGQFHAPFPARRIRRSM
ncbi:hypothetical protein CA85_20590 [Allorhodopirellula solitaria]|uniref:Uncharacterized protein n=1 Tax=Allorhodopirellula solitaria TaxID=2527987 RepID=A0A5C5XWB8_9BACT|nr:hypothetical protein CA85_20590 [Allorhodopirellula solitaria]